MFFKSFCANQMAGRRLFYLHVYTWGDRKIYHSSAGEFQHEHKTYILPSVISFMVIEKESVIYCEVCGENPYYISVWTEKIRGANQTLMCRDCYEKNC